MNAAERRYQARWGKRWEEAKQAIDDDRCPECGHGVRQNGAEPGSGRLHVECSHGPCDWHFSEKE